MYRTVTIPKYLNNVSANCYIALINSLPYSAQLPQTVGRQIVGEGLGFGLAQGENGT